MRVLRSLPALIVAILITAAPLPAPAQFSVGVGFTVGQAPPPLPVFAQPPAPYPNYQWTPGYWAWGPAGYYWVPGVWVAPPAVGLLWTPGYWGASVGGGGFGWNTGYWGASVGFYGGINYGFGYPGTGFYGGSWNGGNFGYNTAVANVNRTNIHNTYNKTVVCNNCNNKNVSFNGGKGGIQARPTADQITSRKNGRVPTTAQKDQALIAGKDRNQLASVNKGKPTLTTSDKPFGKNNVPKNFAPVTTADKQAAAKTPTRGNNQAPTTTQNKPANAMQNKPANKAPGAETGSKPSNKMAQPGTLMNQHQPPSNNQMHHAARPPNQTHQQGRMRPQGQMHQQGQMRPQGHPQGQTHPQGGQKPPQGGQKPPPGGQNKNKPPRR